jgi:hypothetical protein
MGKDLVKEASARFERHFAQCQQGLAVALRDLVVRQSKDGMAKSGSTLRQAVKLFEEHSSRTLDACTKDIGGHVDDRGKRWRSMLTDLRAALDAHIAQAPNLLSKTALMVGPDGPERVNVLLERASPRLRQQFSDFADGWTAPKGKSWRERHPITYALLMIAVGVAAKDWLVWSVQQLKAAVELVPFLLG